MKKDNDIKQVSVRVDVILDKINDGGWESITEEEKQYLNHASKKIFWNKPPN